MGLFDSVNYVNSSEIKKLYSDYNKKSLDGVDEFTMADALEEETPSSHPFMTHLQEENQNYEKAIKAIQDETGSTRKQAEKILSDMAEKSNDKNNQIDYISEMTGMSAKEAEEYFYKQEMVDQLQDQAYGYYS